MLLNYIDDTLDAEEGGTHKEHMKGRLAGFTLLWDKAYNYLEEVEKPKSEEEIDEACERFNNALGAFKEADAAISADDWDIADSHARNRALEELWAAYQAAQCPCAEKPHNH
jgi:hypothetical protein